MRISNLFSEGKDIFVFYRDDNNVLKATKYGNFFPYFYNENPSGIFHSYTGKTLQKVIVSKPSEIKRQRKNTSWEADIPFVKRFLIDKVDVIEPSPIKYIFLDIEILCDALPDVREAKQPISCISAYNSLSKTVQTFYLKEYETEYLMLEAFIAYIKAEKPDLILGWNLVKFDYPYLTNRIPEFSQRISPIGKDRYGVEDVKYPAGISIVDYLTWFKKVTLNKEKQYTLEHIAQTHLKEPKMAKVAFNVLSEELKEKNINDVVRLAKLEEKFNLINYFDEIRRLCKVEWEDMDWNSRAIDMLLLEEAKIQRVILPNKPQGEQEEVEFEGAYREIYESGLLENIGKADISSAYPYAIINFCLDPANIVPAHVPGIKIESTNFKQNPNALVPTVVKKLLVLKDSIKKELSSIPLSDPRHRTVEIKYNAIKGLANSAYGVCGMRYFRLFDVRVASATTFLVRSLLHYVKDKLDSTGHQVVYVDTDGVFYKNPSKEIEDKFDSFVKSWAVETFNKAEINITFAAEGAYIILLLLAKCRYVGRLRNAKGEIETETKGVEVKRKDGSTYIRAFQKVLIDKILDKEPKEHIFTWIKNEIANFRNNKLIDISFPCKLQVRDEEYKNVPIFVRALNNTPELKNKVGETFYYIFMAGLDATKKDMVRAFDEDNYAHINPDEVDWNRMIERNILMKIDVIFTAMKWNILDIYTPPPTSKICSVCMKDKTNGRFPVNSNICTICSKGK